MESIFYVMLLFACIYSTNKKVPHFEDKEFRFEEWHRKDNEFLRRTKTSVVHAAPFRPPVSPFFIGLYFVVDSTTTFRGAFPI
ncbi:hypothetical protein DFH05DRAFT_1516688 [Lentinula detonsa]|uniref:Uncharacterized protein n=1 Tax=Lentinula detonsa TaxID=2804962 RepID=A0A9W8NQH0_9AGAR|nr:hypothetical protein DFH05DRAFT_1516688 [Lentinula detonsa]